MTKTCMKYKILVLVLVIPLVRVGYSIKLIILKGLINYYIPKMILSNILYLKKYLIFTTINIRFLKLKTIHSSVCINFLI